MICSNKNFPVAQSQLARYTFVDDEGKPAVRIT